MLVDIGLIGGIYVLWRLVQSFLRRDPQLDERSQTVVDSLAVIAFFAVAVLMLDIVQIGIDTDQLLNFGEAD